MDRSSEAFLYGSIVRISKEPFELGSASIKPECTTEIQGNSQAEGSTREDSGAEIVNRRGLGTGHVQYFAGGGSPKFKQ